MCLFGSTYMNTRTAPDIWEAALGELQLQVSKPNYRTWLEKTAGLSYQDNLLVVSVPNTFVAEYLDRSQRSLIEKTLIGILGSTDVRVAFQVNGHYPTANGVNNGKFLPAPPNRPGLNPGYVFESFVVGDTNRIAYEAAREVAANPGKSFNPLFIYGGVGLGKTHLLHAVGHAALSRNMQVVCVSAEQFTNDFVSSVRERRMEEFRTRYRKLDVLLIDDISFLSGKEQTEECFFHTFNELHNAARQIVITSNQPPKAMLLTEERLRSRLEWGLVVDVKMPDLPTRLAILQAKVRQKGADVSVDVLELLAEQAKHNIRELEGSLNRIIAYAKLLRASPTREMAELALDSISAKEPASIEAGAPTLLLQAVAETFRLTIDDLKGPRRDREAALARRVAMYLLRQETGISVTQIGEEMGGRDVSAVTHACKKLASELETNNFLKRKIEDIEKRLNSPRGPSL